MPNVRTISRFRANNVGMEELVDESLRRWLADILRSTHRGAQAGAPKDSGNLAGSGSTSISRIGPDILLGTVVFDTDYAASVHQGSQPHKIEGHKTDEQGRSFLANRETGFFVFTPPPVLHPGNRNPNPFLRDALNATLRQNGLRTIRR